jgi:hypothetical protein
MHRPAEVFSMAQQITNPREKIRYYRAAADEAERSASTATDADVRRAYLAIMRTWIYLADELQRELAFAGSVIDQPDDELFVPRRMKSTAYRSR